MTKCLPRLSEPGTGLHPTPPTYKRSNVAQSLTQLQADAKLHFVSSSILVMQTCLHLHVHDSVYSVIGKVQSLSALRERVWPWTSILTPRNERKQRGPYFLQLCECAPLRIKFYTNVPAATFTRKFHANVLSCRSHVTYMDMTKFESPRYDWIEEIAAFIVRLEQ